MSSGLRCKLLGQVKCDASLWLHITQTHCIMHCMITHCNSLHIALHNSKCSGYLHIIPLNQSAQYNRVAPGCSDYCRDQSGRDVIQYDKVINGIGEIWQRAAIIWTEDATTTKTRVPHWLDLRGSTRLLSDQTVTSRVIEIYNVKPLYEYDADCFVMGSIVKPDVDSLVSRDWREAITKIRVMLRSAWPMNYC